MDDFGPARAHNVEAMRDDFHAGNGGLDSDSYRARTVPISVGLDETGTQVTIATLEELRPLTEYQLVFSKQIRDTDGNRPSRQRLPTPYRQQASGLQSGRKSSSTTN